MENAPFLNDFPIKTSIHRRFSIAMFDETGGYAAFQNDPTPTRSTGCQEKGPERLEK